VFQNRSSVIGFWAGVFAVVLGVSLHLPMFAGLAGLGGASPAMGHMAGMGMAGMDMGGMDMAGMEAMAPAAGAMGGDLIMYVGMALILGGTALAAYGLFPRPGQPGAAIAAVPAASAPQQRLGRGQWQLMGVLTLALIIDTMKPASLGFVVPGLSVEYGLTRAQAAWLPFCALCGTVAGSLAWGWICDFYGRRAAILLATLLFIGTSICGAMPSFGWNLFMCFFMGASAGGLLPVAYALLTETLPPRARGWALVLVGGLGSAGGFLAASTAAALLEPDFTWRALWLLGLPTGLLLVLLSRFIPESPAFLHPSAAGQAAHVERPPPEPLDIRVILLLAALTVVGLAWGLVNFGLLLWLPTELVARGQDLRGMSTLISQAALIAAPLALLVAVGYARWNARGTLLAAIAVMVAGLVLMLAVDTPSLSWLGPLPAVVLLVIGTNGVIATILPYIAENTPTAVRGRGTGWIAGASKAGGIAAQVAGLSGFAPSLSPTALFTAALLISAGLLLALYGRMATPATA
jgi:putative MFS transporter